jgi:acetyltransferase-like isoleucine patch superfamily enzyme
VVTRDVAARTVVAGVPARVVSRVVLDEGGVPTFVPDGGRDET